MHTDQQLRRNNHHSSRRHSNRQDSHSWLRSNRHRSSYPNTRTISHNNFASHNSRIRNRFQALRLTDRIRNFGL